MYRLLPKIEYSTKVAFFTLAIRLISEREGGLIVIFCLFVVGFCSVNKSINALARPLPPTYKAASVFFGATKLACKNKYALA